MSTRFASACSRRIRSPRTRALDGALRRADARPSRCAATRTGSHRGRSTSPTSSSSTAPEPGRSTARISSRSSASWARRSISADARRTASRSLLLPARVAVRARARYAASRAAFAARDSRRRRSVRSRSSACVSRSSISFSVSRGAAPRHASAAPEVVSSGGLGRDLAGAAAASPPSAAALQSGDEIARFRTEMSECQRPVRSEAAYVKAVERRRHDPRATPPDDDHSPTAPHRRPAPRPRRARLDVGPSALLTSCSTNYPSSRGHDATRRRRVAATEPASSEGDADRPVGLDHLRASPPRLRRSADRQVAPRSDSPRPRRGQCVHCGPAAGSRSTRSCGASRRGARRETPPSAASTTVMDDGEGRAVSPYPNRQPAHSLAVLFPQPVPGPADGLDRLPPERGRSTFSGGHRM